MKLFGKIQELTQVLWRKNGKEVELTPAEPTVSTVITIPDPTEATEEVVLKDLAQTLTKKIIDADSNTVSNLETDNLKAGVLNTASDLAGASDAQIPSALAVTTYVATAVEGKDDASEITYAPGDLTDWNGSVDPGNVDDGLDQLADRVKTQEGRVYDASEVTYTPSTLTNWDGSADPGQTDDAVDQLAARLKTEETKVQPVDLGGTGQTTYAEGDFLIGNGTSTLSKLPIGAPGRFLLSNDTTASWTNVLSHGAISSENIAFADTKGIESSVGSSTLNVGSIGNTSTLNIGNTSSTTNITGKATLDSVEYASTEVLLPGPTLAITNAHTTFRLKSGFGPDFDTISGATAGRQITVVNETTSPLTITNGTIITGTGADLVIEDGAAVTLLFDGTNWNLIGGAGGGGGLATEFISADPAPAANNTHYLVDCSAGAVTLTLPTPPQPGSVVRASDESGTSATNNITFAGNGNLIDGDSSFIIDVDNGWAQLMWTGTEWTVDTLAVNDGAGLLSLNGESAGTFPTQTFSSTDGSITFNSASGNHDIELADTIAGARTFSDSVYLATSSGSVGIGTSSPDTLFHISAQNFSTTNVNNVFRITDTDTSISILQTIGKIEFESLASGTPGVCGEIILNSNGSATVPSGEFTFNVGTPGSLVQGLNIAKTGAVTLGPSSGGASVNHIVVGGAISNLSAPILSLRNRNDAFANGGRVYTNFYGHTSLIGEDCGLIENTFYSTGGSASGSGLGFLSNGTLVGYHTGSGAWTLGPSSGFAGVFTHNLNGAIKLQGNIPASAVSANVTLIDNFSGTNSTRFYTCGPDTNTRGIYQFYQALSDTSSTILSLVSDANGAWTLGPSSNNQSHIIRGRAQIISAAGTESIDATRNTTTDTDVIVRLRSDVGGSDLTKWRVEADGDTFGGTGGTYTSDLRVKKNVTPIHYGLAEILQLDPMSFNWQHDEEGETKSFTVGSAQKIQELMPELVTDNGLEYEIDGQKQQVKAVYGQEVVAVMVKAIQELSELRSGDADRIAALEAEIELIKNGGA